MGKQKKEPKMQLRIGDTVELSNCKTIGLNRNRVQGILIWRPMNMAYITAYAIWLPHQLGPDEQERHKAFYEKMGESFNQCKWEWKSMTKYSDKGHIIYVPRSFKDNMKVISRETQDLIVGDIVLDRRWYIRFSSQPIRTVLAVKYDAAYDENRICVENPMITQYMSFGNWVYPVLRHNLIKISRRNIPNIIYDEEDTDTTKKGLMQAIFNKKAG